MAQNTNARGNLRNGITNSRLAPDSLLGKNKVNANTVPHEIHAWKIDPKLGEILTADVDTLFLNFQQIF